MKLQNVVLMLSFTLTVTFYGCSSSDTKKNEVKASQPEPAKPPPDTRPVIAAFGDSLTAGFGVDEKESYPHQLQDLLEERGYKYRVVNYGLSGDTTSGGVERVAQVLADKPNIVILELGGNDGLRGLPVKSSTENFEKMIEQFQAAGVKVILAGITLPRNYGMDYIHEFDDMYKALAEKYKVPFIPFLLEGAAMVPGMMQKDGIHATGKGNRVVALTVLRKVEPMLTR